MFGNIKKIQEAAKEAMEKQAQLVRMGSASLLSGGSTAALNNGNASNSRSASPQALRKAQSERFLIDDDEEAPNGAAEARFLLQTDPLYNMNHCSQSLCQNGRKNGNDVKRNCQVCLDAQDFAVFTFPSALAALVKRLKQERAQAESVLRELTPLQGLNDTDAFEAHLRNLILQKTASTDEIKRLTSLLQGC